MSKENLNIFTTYVNYFVKICTALNFVDIDKNIIIDQKIIDLHIKSTTRLSCAKNRKILE